MCGNNMHNTDKTRGAKMALGREPYASILEIAFCSCLWNGARFDLSTPPNGPLWRAKMDLAGQKGS